MGRDSGWYLPLMTVSIEGDTAGLPALLTIGTAFTRAVFSA